MYQAKNTYPYSLTYVSGNVKTKGALLMVLLTILQKCAIIEAWVLSTRKILGGVL